MIVLVGNEKGGCGKTTLATNLAVYRAQAGRDVLLVDADNSRWASLWAQMREESGALPQITCVQLMGKGLGIEVKKLVRRFADVVIDTGAHNTPEFRAALLVADVFLCPFTPGQFDVFGVDRASDLVEASREINPKLVALSVLNEAETTANSRVNRSVIEVVREIPNMTFLEPVYRRAGFRRSTEEGLAVNELKPSDPKSVAEMTRLYREVFQCDAKRA